MHRFPRVIFFLLIVYGLYSGISAQKFGQISDKDWALEPPESYPQAKAIIIFDHADMVISVRPWRVKTQRHVRLKVFNKEGAENALNIEIPFSKGDKIRGLEAYTINPDGEKIKVKEFYSKRIGNYKVRTFVFPAVEDGAILEYKYKHTYQHITFLDPWYFQSNLFTLESKFSATPYPGLTYSSSTHFVPEKFKTPIKEDVGLMDAKGTKFTWTITDIFPAGDEPLAGAIQDYKSSIHFQLKEYRDSYQKIPFYKNWGYIGGIIDVRVDHLRKNSKKLIKSISDSLCSNLDNAEDMIEICYYFMRDEIETREDSKNDTFKKILKNKTANATDKNILLALLLREQEIKSNPMMIGTRDQHTKLNREVSQLNMLNAVICMVPEELSLYGLDTNDKFSIYPYLPPEALVENGLLVKEDSCGMRTVRHHDRKSGIDAATILTINEDGSASCTTSVYIKGYSMDAYLEDISNSDSEFWIENLFGTIETEYSVSGIEITNDRERDRIICELAIDFPVFCQKLDEAFVFSPFALTLFNNQFISDLRVLPIDFQYPSRNRNIIKFILPEGMGVSELPDNIDHQTVIIKYIRTCEARNNLIDIKDDFRIDKPFFSPNEYRMVKEVFDAIDAMNEDQIIFMRMADN